MPSTLTISPALACSFTLGRQYLLQPTPDPLEAVRSLVAIQSQYPVSVPQAIWTRTASLPPGWAEKALTETRQVVKTWGLRWTLHTILPQDLALLTQSANCEHLAGYERFLARNGLSPEQIQQNNAHVLQFLAQGPLPRSELHRLVESQGGRLLRGWGHDVMYLAFRGEVVIVNHGGREVCFARRDRWLPDLPWNLPAEDDARCALLRRYLAAYGPATEKDFRRWTGMKAASTLAAFRDCAAELLPVEVAGWPGLHYILASDERALRAASGEMPAVRLLPKFEVLMLAYDHNLRFMEEGQRGLVSRPAGQIEATVLLQGRVAATWRMSLKRDELKMTLYPFRRLLVDERRLVDTEAERLAGYYQVTNVKVLEGGSGTVAG